MLAYEFDIDVPGALNCLCCQELAHEGSVFLSNSEAGERVLVPGPVGAQLSNDKGAYFNVTLAPTKVRQQKTATMRSDEGVSPRKSPGFYRRFYRQVRTENRYVVTFGLKKLLAS